MVPLSLILNAVSAERPVNENCSILYRRFSLSLCYSASVPFFRYLENNKFIRQCSELNVNQFVSADSLSTGFSIVLSICASFSNFLNTASVSRRSVTQRVDLTWI